jgi:hypothetical protein
MNEGKNELAGSPAGRGWRPGASAQPEGPVERPQPEEASSPEPRPVDPEANDTFVGVARAVRERSEAATEPPTIVWTFRLERYDGSGNRLQPVPIEMRGRSFEGAISEGDTVEVRGRWDEGTTLRPKRVRNLTTGATVGAKRVGKGWLILLALFVVAVLAVFIWVFVWAIHETNKPHRFQQGAPALTDP